MKKFLSILLCVCLLATTIMSVPYVSAEEQAKEYFYHFNDFESLTNDDAWLARAKQGTTMTVESGTNVISGNQSLKTTTSGGGYAGFALSDAKVPQNMKTRVSFDYKVTVGTKGWSGVGYIGNTKAINSAGVEITDCYNWSNVNYADYSNTVNISEQAASTTVRSFKNTITRNDKGSSPPIGIFWTDNKAASEVIFDNVKIAEIIDTVSAVNSDETKGTVAVANKDTSLTDYAMYETAVFTATPAEGYSFKGWYNGDTLVSNEATYEHTLTGDTTLTAKWKLYEKEYFYHFNDFESLTNDDAWLARAKQGTTMTVENGTNVISGSQSLKTTTSGGGYAGFALSDVGVAQNLKTRVSFDYKVTVGTKGWSGVGYIGNTKATNSAGVEITDCYNWSNVNEKYYSNTVNISEQAASTTVRSFKNTITRNDKGSSPPIGIFWTDKNAASEIIFDNVKIAEIIDTVSATSDDEAMGTATVVNKDGYDDYAKNETAVFTATPANGNYFVGWYDANGERVSTDKIYEVKLTTDTNLTAKFAAYDNFVKISFNTNGGSEIEPISSGEGADIDMPANPTKEGYTFAGWYTDEDCTVKYPCKVFPKEDTTLYAKWINGVYQDFENFAVSTSNPNMGEILNDSDYSYDGTHSFKSAVNNGDKHRVIVAQNASEKLSAFAQPGDKITISFKYKLVSGSTNFYPHTTTVTNNVNALASYTNASGSTAYANGYVYYGTNFTETSDEWQTFTHTYTLNSQSYYDDLGIQAEKSLGYTLLYFTAKSDNTEMYVDDVMVYKTIDIPIYYSNEAVRLEPVNAAKPLTAAIQGDTVEFKALCDASVTPTVKYGDNVLTPVDGVYTITVTADDELTVTTEGVTSAQNHAPGVGLNGEDLTKYDADVFMNKIWEGDTVYHEAVMFTNSSDGTVQTTKKLLYPIDDIVSVRNDDLNVWYVKGVDFKVEDGKLVWIDGGKCPIYTGPLAVPANADDPYYDAALNYGGYNSASAYYTLTNDPTKGLYLMSDGNHENYTVYVTYKHSTTWDDIGEEGYTPVTPDNQSYDMDNFYNKLATTDDINVLVYGASTATGCSSTGANVNYELFSKTRDENGNFTVTERKAAGSGISAPTFFEQATSELVKQYGNDNKINYYNIAYGGINAKWGAENLKDRVAGMNEYYGETIVPDIIYIKFVGNDVSTTPESYKASYTSMINDFKELYPNVTIVLVSGKINNEKCSIYGDYRENMMDLEQVLSDLADATPNCIVAKTTSIWAEIVESKDYEDYLSNNINHANDFWAKTTAQIIVASAEKKDGVSAVKTAYNNAAALRSAEASSTGKNGLRIYNEIKNEWISAANIVEYGSVAVFASDIDGEITLQNGRKGIAFSDGTFSAKKQVAWEVKDGSVVFTSYLTNIPVDRYSENILIRSYAIAADGTVYYGEVVTVSLFDIANSVDNANTADGSEPTEEDSNAFYSFVTEANSVKYAEWCTDNGKKVGTLYTAKYSA